MPTRALNACLDAAPKYDCRVIWAMWSATAPIRTLWLNLVRGQKPLLVRGNHDKAFRE